MLIALDGSAPELPEFEMAGVLCEKTGIPVPAPLGNLKDKTVRFSADCAVDEMEQQVYDMLRI
ncbi:MAG: hypothetical protein J6Y62_06040 [Clostridia bacterium]|nr:hypothetical protein [Clostridia bacterium]